MDDANFPDALEICGVCASCGQAAAFRCAACQIATYCSVDCQRMDWRLHHVVCAQHEARQAAACDDRVRSMMGNTLDQHGILDSDAVWGARDQSVINMGLYGDLAGAGYGMWDTVDADVRDSVMGSTNYGTGKASNLSLSKLGMAYSEGSQRRNEIDDLSRGIDEFQKKMTAATICGETSVSEWAMIASEAANLVNRQVSLLSLQASAIDAVVSESESLKLEHYDCLQEDLGEDISDGRLDANPAWADAVQASEPMHFENSPPIGLADDDSEQPGKKVTISAISAANLLNPTVAGLEEDNPVFTLKPVTFPEAHSSPSMTHGVNGMKSLKKLILSKMDDGDADESEKCSPEEPEVYAQTE